MKTNIVESGLHPEPEPTLERTVLQLTDDICKAMMAAVKQSLANIKAAELAAIARLEKYVPTERLLDRHEAAAYLKLRVRQLDVLTRPASTQIPFSKIGSLKRFRKPALDAWLEEHEVKKKRVVL